VVKRVLIGLAIVAGLGLIVWASLRKGGDTHGDAVYAESAVQQSITRTVKASGEIDARITVDLSAHVVAKVETLYVKEGQEVKAGQPILELERDVFTAAVESWRAQLRQAQAAAKQAEVELADARTRMKRMDRLIDEGIVATEDVDSARLREESAQLQLEQAQDQVEYTQANLTKALDDLGKTTIYSPIDGRVVSLNAEPGEVVVSGLMNNPATKIATIADLSELLAELDVDENEIVAVQLGQPVSITVDAVADRELHGKVTEVGSSGYTLPGQGDVTFFKVDVLLDEPDADLRPGMSVRAEIEVATHDDAVVVPIEAVVERDPKEPEEGGDGDAGDEDAAGAGDVARSEARRNGRTEPVEVVYVVEDGVAHRREVETGISTVTEVEIVSGLSAGETVVTGPFRTLRDLEDSDPVHIEEEKDSP
jgi:HlyD family secretion protein